jgi:hypothetical protein
MNNTYKLSKQNFFTLLYYDVKYQLFDKNKLRHRIQRSALNCPSGYRIGTAKWLQAMEVHFGGIEKVIRLKSAETVDKKNIPKRNRGGDRMFHHNYAEIYARYIVEHISIENPTIVECGILKGTGLAVWSRLFPDARIIGLDIDPSVYLQNKSFLIQKGAFPGSEPVVLKFDQFNCDTTELESVLGCQKIDIFIDDGHHSIKSIVYTLMAVRHLLSGKFLYFIEDNSSVAWLITALLDDCEVYKYGRMTVIKRG